MSEVAGDQLRSVVETQHGCPAQLVEAVAVTEPLEGGSMWKGVVHVFDIQGHRAADRCFAWSSPLEGTDRRRFYAVLGVPPINSAADAVRATIVAECKAGRNG